MPRVRDSCHPEALTPTPSRQIASSMAAATPREAPPPPMIGKVGKFTVFITPPRSPKLTDSPTAGPGLRISDITSNVVPSLSKASPSTPPPPVQVPPLHIGKSAPKSSGSVFGFFWDAFAKVQDAHSSLDEYLAHWFGLNRSKYQWAVNEYFDDKGKKKEVVSAANPSRLPAKN